MSTTSSTSGTYSSATSTSSIDVASIVSQLMTVANQPLTAINNQITSDNLIISDLGTMKSKLATFQTALTTFESPSTYNTVVASSNNSTAVSGTAQNGTTQGRYNVNVSQTAEASNISVAGFTSATAATTLDGTFTDTHGNSHSGFSVTLAGQTYYSDTLYNSTSIPPTTGGTLTALPASTTLDALTSWVNGLSSNFNAPIQSSVVQTATGAYSLVINGTSTGVTNAISFAGLNGNFATTSIVKGDDSSSSTTTVATSSVNGPVNGLTVTSNINARDAKLTVNGLAVQRSSNSINDVISGLTLNLSSPVAPATTVATTAATTSSSSPTVTISPANLAIAKGQSVSGTGIPGGTTVSDVSTKGGVTTVTLSSNSTSGGNPSLTFGFPSTAAQSALITVGPGTDTSSTTINSLITAYNDVISQYKTMTANAANSSSTATSSFGNDPEMLDFVGSFKQFMSQGFLTSTSKSVSLSNIGIDMNLDGTLAFNATKFATGQSDGSIAALANGVSVGGSVSNSNNLDLALSAVVDPGGLIDSLVNTENTTITNLTAKQADLQTKLAQQQTDYTTQYSNLNALLFTLNQTSTQLTSSLAGLTSGG